MYNSVNITNPACKYFNKGVFLIMLYAFVFQELCLKYVQERPMRTMYEYIIMMEDKTGTAGGS
jgi:hypothetical protein